MRDDKNRQVRLTAVGFDDRSEESFRIAFRGPGKGKAILVEDGLSEGGIINMDSAEAKTLWSGYRERFPDKPAIVVGFNDPGIEDAVFVKKPATIDKMMEAVESLIQGLDSEEKPAKDSPSVEKEPDSTGKFYATPAAKPAVKAAKGGKFSLFYNPREYLQSEIHSAVEYSLKSGVAVEIWVMTGDDHWGKIIFLPGLKKVLTSFSESELKQYFSTPLSLVTHKMYRRKEKATQLMEDRVRKEKRGASYESFLWKTALYTSLGRLPQGTNLASTMYLKHWPNLTRLYPLGGSMRIATLLVDQPNTLPLVAKVLKMPAGRVFSFYSAACAIGLVESNENSAVNLGKNIVPKKHRDHTLFGRILKRLRSGDSEFEAYA